MPTTPRKSSAKPTRRPKPAAAPPPAVAFTHLDKLMFPEKGFTKGDVLAFYAAVAPFLLPHLKDRPITLERLPDGLSSPSAPRFWQKNTPPYYPAWIPRAQVPGHGDVHYTLVNDANTLLYLVNQGAITFHPFLSRVGSIEQPDYLLFDLDPGDAGFPTAVATAKVLHKILDKAGYPSFPKTSGKSGLHVMVPWHHSGGYEPMREWASAVAEKVVAELPDRVTTERMKANRHGRLYLDVMQNGLGKHIVPPYVCRVTPLATVSTPLKWSEVTAKLDPRKFDIKTILKRLKSKDLMADALPH